MAATKTKPRPKGAPKRAPSSKEKAKPRTKTLAEVRSERSKKGAETRRLKREAAATAAAEPGSLRIPIGSLVGILTNVAIFSRPGYGSEPLCGSEWSIRDGVLNVATTDTYALLVEKIATDTTTTMSGSGVMLLSAGERATMLAACKTIPKSTWNGPRGGPPVIFAEIQFGTRGAPRVLGHSATDDSPAVPEVPAVPGLPGTAKIGRSTIKIAVDLATEWYPDWKQLVPDPLPEVSATTESVAYNPRLLARMAKVCAPGRSTPTDNFASAITVVSQGGLKPTVITVGGIVVLLMPVRS